MTDFAGAFSNFGGAAQDLFGASAFKKQAAGLEEAADMEDINARLAGASAGIQQTAARRDVAKITGGQAADISAAGFRMSGSALDVARDTARQGAITEALIANQGMIDVQGHRIQASSLRTQAAAARSSARGSAFGGLLKAGLGIFSLFSDERMKENVRRVGTDDRGLPVVSFNYVNDKTRYVGYLAQDVEKIDPAAVTDLGVKMVSEEYRAEAVDG